MASKRFSLTGKSYPAVRGGMVHKGAQGTADDFKRWLSEEGYKKALKAKRFVEVEAEPKPKTRGPGKPKDTEAAAESGDADEGDTGGSATGGAQRA